MPIPSVTFRSELPPVVQKELDQHDTELTAYLLKEHTEDGGHTDISADSIIVDGPVTINGGPLIVDGTPITGGFAPHAPSHSLGGVDPVNVRNLAGYPGVVTQFLNGTGAFTVPPTALHQITHHAGQVDALDVKTLAGYPGGSTTFLRADGTFQTVPAGTPTAHHATHEPGGTDALVNAAWLHQTNVFTQANTFNADVAAALGVYERSRTARMGEWIAYAPGWLSSAAPSPALGNGALTGRYAVVGKTVYVQIRFQIGSVVTLGGGFWAWTTPLPVAATSQLAIGSGLIYNFADGKTYQGLVDHAGFFVPALANALALMTWWPASSAAVHTQQGIPITWGTGLIDLSATYETT
jgi:hypothetical protein